MVTESIDIAAPTLSGAGHERLLVEFELAGERYGVDIADIKEIMRYQSVTVVPGTPEVVEGIINLRGRVTPIVDLRKRIGLGASAVDEATRIVVIELGEALVGVHVDAVTGVVSLTDEQVQPLGTEVTGGGSDYLEGVADVDGRLIVLINLGQAIETGTSADFEIPIQRETPAQAEPEAVDAAAAAPVAEDMAAEGAAAEEEPNEALEQATEVPAEAEGDPTALGLNVELLEQSFEAVKPHAETLVERFYENLFEQYPEVQPLFANADMAEQRGKLLSALATVVASLRQPDALVPHLEELGRRHVAYGAEPAHYEAVGTVLIETLGEIAGDLWTDELRDAWSDAVTLVATVMIDAASAVETPAVATPEPPVKDPTAKEPTAKKPTAKKASAKAKPAAKKPAAKSGAGKTASKKPAAGKPASRSRARGAA
jgi:chemotaxis signal transduction protein/hemoglobin-like flavoprotein